MANKVVIIGAGGHAKVIADIIVKNNDKLLGFLDDNKKGIVLADYSVIGKVNNCIDYIDEAEFIVAIGDNAIRKNISERFKLKWYTAIHPSAQIGLGCEIGEGTVIMANAVINSDTKIGKHCIINTAAIVDHENSVGDFVHISPNATLCGAVMVGECTHIGAGAIVRNGISIGDDIIVGAGATVVKNIIEQGKYVGVPAKIIR